MGALFDLRTLFLIGSLAGGICAVTLFASRRIHRPSESALSWAAASQLLFSLSMLMISLRGIIPDWLSVVLGNTTGPAGMIVLYESIRRLCQMPPRPGFAVTAIAAVMSLQILLGPSLDLFATRLQITSAIQGGYAALMLPLLRRRLPADPRVPMLCAIGLAGFFVGVHLTRLIWIVAFGAQTSPDGQFAAGLLQSVIAATFTLAPMMHAMVLMSLVNGRISADLRRIATTDDLTGLATRRHFFGRVRERLGREGSSVAVLMLDLDWFKQVNDRYGHKIGDRVLVHFSCLLRSALAAGDHAARYGGEEFCALFERATEEQVRGAAQALCDAVRASPFEQDSLTIPITVSIGVALVREGGSVEELVSIADRRVYLAKAMGRDRVVDRTSARRAAAAGREHASLPLHSAMV